MTEEIKIIKNKNKEINIPSNIWIDSYIDDFMLKIKINDKELEINLNDGESLMICSEKDLDSFLSINNSLTKEKLRLKIIETQKWGNKPVFIDGVNNICFKILKLTIEFKKVIILFNTNGTKDIESFYLHGIWIVN